MARILVVDDEEMIRTLLVGVLIGEHHHVDAADCAEKGVELVQLAQQQGQRFDLIITDLNMPKVNGLEFMRHVKVNHIPMLVFTAMATKEMVVESVRAGATDFMAKGKFHSKSFIERVNKLLARSPHNSSPRPTNPTAPAKTGPQQAAPSSAAAAPTDPNMEKKIDRIRDIDALSFVATEIIKISSDRGSSAKELVETITKDQCIASKVLRMSNSAFYKTHKRIRNLEDAVINIGFSGIQEMAVAVSVVEQFKDGDKDGLDRIELWKHCILAATLARRAAVLVKYPSPERAFLAGLLHDIGILMADGKFHEQYITVMTEVKEGRGLLGDVEKRILGMEHGDLAGKVLHNWNFPEVIRDAIALHHHPLEGILNLKGKDHTLIALCILADTLAQILNMSHVGFENFHPLDARLLPLLDKSQSLTPPMLFDGLMEEYRDLETLLLMSGNATFQAKSPDVITAKGRMVIMGATAFEASAMALRWVDAFEVERRETFDLSGANSAIILLPSSEQARKLPALLKARPQPVKPLVLVAKDEGVIPGNDDVATYVRYPLGMTQLDSLVGVPT